MTIQSIYTNTSAMASRRYVGINGDKLSIYQEQLSTGSKVADPSKDPSSAAIGYLLDSTLQILDQAVTNANQATAMVQLATGTLGSTQEILTRMSALAAQANSDAISESQRTLLDREYQVLLKQINENSKITWAGTQLFTGGAGVIDKLGTQVELINGAKANVFTALNTTQTRGFISGSVKSVDVQDTAQIGQSEVSVVVGDQTFVGRTSGIAQPTLNAMALTAGAGTFPAGITIEYANSTGGSITGDAAHATAIAALISSHGSFVNGDTILTGTGNIAGLSIVVHNTGVAVNLSATSAATTVITLSDGTNTATRDIAAAALTATVATTGTLILDSTSDRGNRIVLDYSNNTVNAYTAATSLRTQLNYYLGLSIGAPASFQSVGGDFIFTNATNTAYNSGSSMAQGVWGISLVKDTVDLPTYRFELTNGINKYKSPIDANQVNTDNLGSYWVAGSFFFDNGFQINIPLDTNAAYGGLSTTQAGAMALIRVSGGERVTRSFQIGQNSSDLISMQFNSTTTTTIGLDNTSLNSKENARAASKAVIAAMSAINVSIADFGGIRSQLEAINKNLELSMQNQTAAKATFTDTDIPNALMQSQRYKALMDTASAMLQNTLQRYKDMSELIKQASR